MGIKNSGQQWKLVGPTATTFSLILIDVPIEVIVGVTPSLHTCQTRSQWSRQRQKMILEVALHQQLMLMTVQGSGIARFRFPAEQGVTVMLLEEISVGVAEIPEPVQQCIGQQGVGHMQHRIQARW